MELVCVKCTLIAESEPREKRADAYLILQGELPHLDSFYGLFLALLSPQISFFLLYLSCVMPSVLLPPPPPTPATDE